MPVSRLKFGPRSVRVPNDIMLELSAEKDALGKQGPIRYRVRAATVAERIRESATHVAFLCDANGRRLRGVGSSFFTPKRYERRPRPTTAAARSAPVAPPPAPAAPVPGSGDADHGNTGGLPPTSTDAAPRSPDEPVPGGSGCGDGYPGRI